MDGRRSRWLLLPAPLRRLPADLVAALVVTALVNVAVFAPIVRETPLRIPLGLAFVLFVPGYVFIAALFPERGESPASEEFPTEDELLDSDDRDGTGTESETDEGDTDESSAEAGWSTPSGILPGSTRSGIDGIERVALSFGLSIAIVPLLGLVLNFTPWGIRLVPIMVAVTAFTLAATAVAALRRWDLPEEERFRVPYRSWYRAAHDELFAPETRTDGVLNVLLVCSIVLALGTVTFAVAVPPEGEQFSAIYLLTEDEDGELVADNYPTEFVEGESQELIVGVDNNEHRTVEYTVVALEQATETEGNETVVTEERELDRFDLELEHNESAHHRYELTPTLVGEDVRVIWLLYPDEVPTDPSVETAENDVHLWVNVTEASE